MATVSELLAQKAAIEQQIAEAQRAERAGAAGDTALEAALRRRVTVVESGGAPASAMP